MLQSLVISDPETVEFVTRLAQLLGTGKTHAVNQAAKRLLLAHGVDVEAEKAPSSARERELIDLLNREMRAMTRRYVEFREKVTQKPSGSRAYGMIHRHGPVEAIRRLMENSTDGFKFILENDGNLDDLAYEALAIDPRFASIVPPGVRAKAAARLAEVRR